jgi:hypothetical protein
VIDRLRSFIADSFSRPWHHNGLLESDKGGFTRTEYDLLRSPGDLRWPIMRAGLKTGGRLSEGIRLGWRTGFDSGATLDYVYENRPRGRTIIAAASTGFISTASAGAASAPAGKTSSAPCANASRDTPRRPPVRILDIASGPGRYVLETMKAAAVENVPATALLRDYRQPNLDAAAALAEQLGVRDVTTAAGDAFDGESLAAITPRPTIAIVSGLFELIPDNEHVLRSLRGLADATDHGLT